ACPTSTSSMPVSRPPLRPTSSRTSSRPRSPPPPMATAPVYAARPGSGRRHERHLPRLLLAWRGGAQALPDLRSAMPMFQARRLCPDAVIIPPEFSKYRAESARIMAKLEALTPLVQLLSLDEAWVELAGSERPHGGSRAEVLTRLQAEIELEIGITVSVGLAANKFLAKIASDLDK